MDIKERARIIVANGGWGDGRLLTFAEDVHAALSDGVAYMPVPRCETCGHWKEARSGVGWCGVKREKKIQTTPGANLVTSADFGCTEWKEK